MNTFKDIFAFCFIMLVLCLISLYLGSDNPIVIAFYVLGLGFFIFNLIVRKSLAFKNYFTSPLNLFTTKARYQKSYDIPKDLMFEKTIEVLRD